MPDLPQRKVGIVACSGEELPEGTVTRLAALKVLEELRPGQTVTICLPLFLAGGEGDRAFAKFYPTIARGWLREALRGPRDRALQQCPGSRLRRGRNGRSARVAAADRTPPGFGGESCGGG